MTEIMTELTNIKVMLAIMWLFGTIMYVLSHLELERVENKVNQLRTFIVPKCKHKKQKAKGCSHCAGYNIDCDIYKSGEEEDANR